MRRLIPLLLLASCADRGEAPPVDPPPPQIRRLTQLQYTNTVHDVFGATVVVPTSLEPDMESAGLFAVGASLGTVSPRGVEQYEDAAYQIAEQVMVDPALRADLIPCEPAATRDDACAGEAIDALGRRLYRRSLTAEEAANLTGIAGNAADVLGDFDLGFQYAIAAMLQSPDFLYRVDLGEPAPDGGFRFSSVEMAGRLSFFLWNTTPDDALLDAAEAGDLVDDELLAATVDRMLADPRARSGSAEVWTEMLRLWELDHLNKDPLVYTHMSPEVGPSAKAETLANLDRIVFDEDRDIRTFLFDRRTVLDRKLASIYDVPAPAREGFGATELPGEGPRAGYLGQVSFLALNAHPSSSSATLRGQFVREVLLCQELPPPPANLNTAIPEATEDSPTLRDRVAIHLEDPSCASCHNAMDPIGLGFEQFDGLGGYRETENGAQIDPSGILDGYEYDDALGLEIAIFEHQSLGPCFAETLLKYANGHVVADGEMDALQWHADGFGDQKFRTKWLLRDIALSPAFRSAGEVRP